MRRNTATGALTRWSVPVLGVGVAVAVGSGEPLVAAVAAFSVLAAWVGLRPLVVGVDGLVAKVERPADPTLHPTLPGLLVPVARRLEALAEEVAKTRRAAADEAARVARLLEHAPVGIMLVDREGRIEACSARFRELLPPRLAPVGRLPVEAFSVEELYESIDVALKGQIVRDRACASAVFDVAITAAPTDEGAMVILRDITQFRRAERARTDFVANVSHELRTPVAAILGYSETLLEDAHVPPALVPLLEALHRNGRRLSRLFDDLLELHRVESRRRELPRERVEVRPIVVAAVGAVVDKAALKEQSFTVEVDPTVVAWSNREALSAVIANLASNAYKYTPKGGRIVVRASQDPTGTRVEVEDTGRGIAPAHHERIFERFYRVDEGRASAGGAGLGLAIVKHLCAAMGATVSVQSQEGKGSRFSVFLPEPDPEAPQPVWDATLG